MCSSGRVWSCPISQRSLLPTFAPCCCSLTRSQTFSALCQVCNLNLQNGQRIRQNAQQQQNPSLHWEVHKIKGERREEQCTSWPTSPSLHTCASKQYRQTSLTKAKQLLTSKHLFYLPNQNLYYNLPCWNNTVIQDFINIIKFCKHCLNRAAFYFSCGLSSYGGEVLV